MAAKVKLRDPYGILQELNPDAPTMVDAQPDIEGGLARIEDRIPRANYLEPYFFHPEQAVQARAASASVSIDVGKLGDYLTNVLATATDATTLKAAATAVWKRHESGNGSIAYAVDSLRAYLHSLGLDKARQIVGVLLKNAPNGACRTMLSNEASTRGENLLPSDWESEASKSPPEKTDSNTKSESESIEFSCPKGHRLRASKAFAGKKIRCPRSGCGAILRIPADEAVASSPSSAESSETAKRAEQAKPSAISFPAAGLFCDGCNGRMSRDEVYGISASYDVPSGPDDVYRIYCRKCASGRFFEKLGGDAVRIQKSRDTAIEHLRQSGRF